MKELTISSDAPGEKLFMLGNEAIARGAIEAGIQVATAYPGTPSSEILETLAGVAKQLGIYVEWSTNEKVAFLVTRHIRRPLRNKEGTSHHRRERKCSR